MGGWWPTLSVGWDVRLKLNRNVSGDIFVKFLTLNVNNSLVNIRSHFGWKKGIMIICRKGGFDGEIGGISRLDGGRL